MENNKLVEKAVGGFISMTVAVTETGEIRLGNDPHCVMKKQRPPLNPMSGKPHPGDLLQEADLMALASQISQAMAEKYGIVTTQTTFVEKTSMPRATE
jgi:hypothetical protein